MNRVRVFLTWNAMVVLFLGMSTGCEEPGNTMSGSLSSQQVLNRTKSSNNMGTLKNEYTVMLDQIRPQLQKQLNAIQDVQMERFGFEDRSEFARATMGHPYKEYKLRKDASIVFSGHWLVPVVVDGDYRAMLIVILDHGKYSIGGVGSASQARNLDSFEKEYFETAGNSPAMERSILNVFSNHADFVVFNDDLSDLKLKKGMKFYAMASARAAYDSEITKMVGELRARTGEERSFPFLSFGDLTALLQKVPMPVDAVRE